METTRQHPDEVAAREIIASGTSRGIVDIARLTPVDELRFLAYRLGNSTTLAAEWREFHARSVDAMKEADPAVLRALVTECSPMWARIIDAKRTVARVELRMPWLYDEMLEALLIEIAKLHANVGDIAEIIALPAFGIRA